MHVALIYVQIYTYIFKCKAKRMSSAEGKKSTEGMQTEMDDEVRDGLAWVLADLVRQADGSFGEVDQFKANGLLLA
jgi:hypothetical protein